MALEKILEEIVSEVLSSPKFKGICPEVVQRTAEEVLRRKEASKKDLTKTVKRKLHQIYGAFLSHQTYTKAQHLILSLERGAELKEVSRSLLSLHTSTAERLPYYEQFYRDLFAVTGVPKTLLDLACGFNPFSLPFAFLKEPLKYFAYDIDSRLVGLINSFFRLLGYEPLAETRDILLHPPRQPADLALAMKLLPTLEQQRKGSGVEVLQSLRASYIGVTFSTQSLCGKGKGMRKYYSETYGKLLRDQFQVVSEQHYPTELLIVIKR